MVTKETVYVMTVHTLKGVHPKGYASHKFILPFQPSVEDIEYLIKRAREDCDGRMYWYHTIITKETIYSKNVEVLL